MKKAIVLGGGFAGVQAAIELKKKGIFDVTLISDRDYFYIYPISIWIPTHEMAFEDAKIQLSEIQSAHNIDIVIDKVTEIRSSENRIICENQTYDYDYLVIAIGADKMKHTGIENTLSICGKPEISVEISNSLDELVNKGGGKIAIGFGGNPKDKSAVRGGPGFELLFNIHNYLKEKKIRDQFELSFFAPMEKPGQRMGKKSLSLVDEFFNSYDLKKYFGKKIKEFTVSGIIFEDDSKLESDLTIFIPASAGHSILQNSDLPLSEAGFIKIDDNTKVKGLDNVYAVGDVAALDGPDWKAKQGHLAELMAHNAAFNIYNYEKGIAQRRGYQEHLNILCIMDTGNGAAFVYRDSKKDFVIPMPIFGHWLKQAWGKYTKLTKRGIIPRIPGL